MVSSPSSPFRFFPPPQLFNYILSFSLFKNKKRKTKKIQNTKTKHIKNKIQKP